MAKSVSDTASQQTAVTAWVRSRDTLHRSTASPSASNDRFAPPQAPTTPVWSSTMALLSSSTPVSEGSTTASSSAPPSHLTALSSLVLAPTSAYGYTMARLERPRDKLAKEYTLAASSASHGPRTRASLLQPARIKLSVYGTLKRARTFRPGGWAKKASLVYPTSKSVWYGPQAVATV